MLCECMSWDIGQKRGSLVEVIKKLHLSEEKTKRAETITDLIKGHE